MDDNPSHLLGIIEACEIGRLGLAGILGCPSRQLLLFSSLAQVQASQIWDNIALLIIGPSHNTVSALQMVRDIHYEATTQILTVPPIVVFSPYADTPLFQIDAAYSGASGCIKTPVYSGQQMKVCIDAVLVGQSQFGVDIIQGVRDIETPSQRELEVLRLMADYCTNPEIARELCLAPKTIDAHVSRIFTRLRVNNRRAAIHRAKHLGWIR